MWEKLEQVAAHFADLTKQLADPQVYNDPVALKKVNAERKSLEETITTYEQYKKLKKETDDAKELLTQESDAELIQLAKEEIKTNEAQLAELEKQLVILLLPRDPLDDKNVMMEIRAGTGGDEAAIFVADVYRMYQNYFRDLGFKSELISTTLNDHGMKEVIFSVTGEKVYAKLKYEAGVHRVQRVPKTEAQGRIHTSTITVAVMPEVDEVDFELDMNDVRIDVYRSGGSGGQSVNTTDSAVRVTHIPTGMVVAIQDEKSQIKNKDKALKILRNRIYDKMLQDQKAQVQAERREQVGTGDRSERIRTYNFPQSRLTDHRIGLTLYSLEKIMEGDLHEVTAALMAHQQDILLKGQNSNAD